jgi:hypothetical protein
MAATGLEVVGYSWSGLERGDCGAIIPSQTCEELNSDQSTPTPLLKGKSLVIFMKVTKIVSFTVQNSKNKFMWNWLKSKW